MNKDVYLVIRRSAAVYGAWYPRRRLEAAGVPKPNKHQKSIPVFFSLAAWRQSRQMRFPPWFGGGAGFAKTRPQTSQ